MADDPTLKIPQIGDRIVMAKFSELKARFGEGQSSAKALTIGEIVESPEKNSDGNYSPPWDKIHELNASLVQTFYMRIRAITVAYYRRGKDRSSPIYDEISIAHNPNIAMDVVERMEIAAWAERTFKAFDPKRSTASASPSAELAALHESTLTRLEGVAEKIIEETASAYTQLEHSYLAKRERLEKELAAARATQEEEHGLRMSALDAKEAELLASKAAIDDRNNTHARRATRNAMLQDVKNRIQDFGVSSNTARKRTNVTRGFTLLFIALIALLIWSVMETSQLHDVRKVALAAKTGSVVAAPPLAPLAWDKSDLYFVWARISILTVGLLLSILYYIKWENQWATQHANAEFQLQQFYIDVNRANWVVESGLEWHKETGSTIPDTIMQSLTTNLFKFHDESPPVLHPADELASALLGSASTLKLKAGENELLFNKPSKITGKG